MFPVPTSPLIMMWIMTHRCLVCMDDSTHLMNLQFICVCNTREIYRFHFAQCVKDNIHIENISNGCYPQPNTK